VRSVRELMDLSGRRALVTGGAGHVGRAAAETLLELGASVALLDRAHSTPPKQDALAVVCDLEDEAATRAAVGDVTQRLGGLDIVVHAAGFVGTTEVEG
jgi:NAD(P)-dependent dehydrogenase (short-subunit alcohol dehydrogenase family)